LKQIKEPESSSNLLLAGDRPLGLPDYLRELRQNPAEHGSPPFDWLAFFKKLNFRPKDLLKPPNLPVKPAKVTRLASGLPLEKTLEIVDGLETALSSFKAGVAPFPRLDLAGIRVRRTGTGLEIILPTAEAGEINLQRELTALLYLLVTGQELAVRSPAAQLDALAGSYPHTVNVLRQGWQDGYSSTRQLCGAFGWSLFRRENLPLSDEQIEANRLKLAEKPKKAPVKELDLPPVETRPANRGIFPGALALTSLIIGLVLIVAFLVFSLANPPVPVQRQATVSPTPTLVPTPTAPTGLLNTRQADGIRLTRLNPANLSQAEQKYVGPDDLAPGQAVKLNSQRDIRALNAEWSLGQNVYLTLQDGGWEVWDSIGNNRISRRELSDSDQYTWVSWSPDGENFAAEGLDGQLRLGTGGRVLRTIPFLSGPYYYPEDNLFPLSWSPDSSMLMVRNSVDIGKFQIWTFKGTPQPVVGSNNVTDLDLRDVTGNANLGQAVWSWSGDSRYIAFYMPSGLLHLVTIYDTRTLEKAGSLTIDFAVSLPAGEALVDSYSNSYSNSVRSGGFAWSPDGKYMALQRWIKGVEGGNAYQRVLLVWEVPSVALSIRDGNPVMPLTYQFISLDNPDSANLLAWSRDNRLLVDSREVVTVNNGPVVRSNKLLVFDYDRSGFNWNISYSIPLPDLAYDVKSWWAPDGQRFLVSDDLGYLAIYGVPPHGIATSRGVSAKVLAKPVTDQVDMAVPSPDGIWLATYSKASGPQLRDLRTGQLDSQFSYPTNNGTVSYEWSADSRYLALVYSWPDGNIYNPHTKTVVRVWSFDNTGAGPSLYADVSIPTAADFAAKVKWNSKSAGPELLYEQDQNTVGVLPVTKGTTIPAPRVTPTAGATPTAATSSGGPGATASTSAKLAPTLTPALSASEQYTISVGESPVVTFSIPNPNQLQTAPATPGQVSKDWGLLWPRSTIPQFWTVPRAWAADWSFLVGPLDNTRDYGILRLAPPDSKDPPTKMAFQPSTEEKPVKATITAAAVSPDGRMVALGFDNGLVQLYDASNGKLFQAYNAHQVAITVLAFSPDSKDLATGSIDHTVKVWETTNWKNTAVLRGQTRPVNFVQWLPDNKTLVSSSSAPNTAVLWRIS
jgi:WD40 repeat protein